MRPDWHLDSFHCEKVKMKYISFYNTFNTALCAVKQFSYLLYRSTFSKRCMAILRPDTDK